MLPIAKAIGITLCRSTAATRPVASVVGITRRRSIQGPITTAPVAWHRPRRPDDWPARIRCQSTTYSCVSYRRGTHWQRLRQQTLKHRLAPKASPARGLKVVCLPEQNITIGLHAGQLILPIIWQPGNRRFSIDSETNNASCVARPLPIESLSFPRLKPTVSREVFMTFRHKHTAYAFANNNDNNPAIRARWRWP